MSERIDRAFALAREEKRALFVSYLCAGDPDFATSLEACKRVIENGTEVLELGVPFSDPVADGPTNQLAAERALAAGMTQAKLWELVRELRKFTEIPIILYTYYNLVLAHGEAEFAAKAVAAGVDGVLTLDLPPEEAQSLLSVCRAQGLANIFILAPTTPPERIALISGVASGFLYYVSRTGVTGTRENMSADLEEHVAQIRRNTDLPLVVGFGISRPKHVRQVGAIADGVVVGSALVNCFATSEPREAQLDALAAKMRYLRGV